MLRPENWTVPVGLELHSGKTRIVYCKDADRRGSSEHEQFSFLGYTFRPRLSKNKHGKHFVNFSPAVSDDARKAISQEIRSWHITRRSDKTLSGLVRMFNAIVHGWVNYYGRFYKSWLYPVLRHINDGLVRWAMRKYKRLHGHTHRAKEWLANVARRAPGLRGGRVGCDFLGCHFHARMSAKVGEQRHVVRYYLQRRPSLRSMKRARARVEALTGRSQVGMELREVIERLNLFLRGWGNYCVSRGHARSDRRRWVFLMT